MQNDKQGISNRESAAEEDEERQEFPPIKPSAAPREQEGSQSATEKQVDAKDTTGRDGA